MPSSGNEANSERLARRVLGGRVALLFDGYALSLGTSFAAAAVFVAVQWLNNPSPLLAPWLLTLCGLLLYRGSTAWRYFHRRDVDIQPEPGYWLLQTRIGSSLTAAIWGIGGLLFFTPGNEMLQIFTVLVIAGMSAGALNALGADFPSYRNYVALALGPLSIMALAQGSQMQTAVGLLILLLLGFLLKSGRQNANTIEDTLQLRYANADLLENLKQQQHQVAKQAEAMIGQLVSNAPVSLWVTDRAGKVNFVSKVKGHSNRLQQPNLGDSLLDTFADEAFIAEKLQLGLQGKKCDFEVQQGEHYFEIHLDPLLGDNGESEGLIGVTIDISERKQTEQQLTERANYDQLTGLANRGLAMEEIQRALLRSERNGTLVALYFLDLDNFKAINDTMGHKAGDQLLQQTAERLNRTTRGTDFAARISGDEFLVLAEGLQLAEHAESVAYKITSSFRRAFLLDNREIHASASVGVALYPRDGSTPGDLLQCADTAMYHAKESGKSSYCFFTAAMQQEAERAHMIETELRQALGRGELQLHYQPKVDAQSQVITGAEVLLRWESEKLGTVSPEEFIPVAELAGLMPEIGAWILRTACSEYSRWPGNGGEPLHIAINISPQQFRKTDLLANVTEALVDFGLPAECLELEITESLLVQDAPSIINAFEALNHMGVKLALDDFGTGYSSLSYLRKFPMQVLKIDKSFVQGLGVERDTEALVHTIIAMAKSLNMQVVAEGVETTEQLHYLQQHGADLIQGYYFSRPLTADAFFRLLDDRNGAPLQPADYSEQAARPLARSG